MLPQRFNTEERRDRGHGESTPCYSSSPRLCVETGCSASRADLILVIVSGRAGGYLAASSMLRKKIFPGNKHLQVRGTEIQRIEALSDAVFAFSVSLLIMSLEVPKTFAELQHTIRDIPPFLATFSLVFLFWYQQNAYFRRYGLQSRRVILLNLALLAWLLVYIFPLKFLFTILLSWFTGVNYFSEVAAAGDMVLAEADFPRLVVFFSAGYCILWLLFFLLYRHAWQQRILLKLSGYEAQVLRYEQRDAVFNLLVGAASLFLAWLQLPEASGFPYLLIPVWMLLNYVLMRRRIRSLPA